MSRESCVVAGSCWSPSSACLEGSTDEVFEGVDGRTIGFRQACEIRHAVLRTGRSLEPLALDRTYDRVSLASRPFAAPQAVPASGSRRALRVARWLEAHAKIERVIYPGLESHPRYALAGRQMTNGGGMVAAYLKADDQQTIDVLSHCRRFALAT